ncbi:EpsG family protein [Escherichia albertii]|uniref:EpsG family protein n=1 Tax=Escherichia albertii TaxID=208962 RepID=UPI003B63422E
MQIRTSNLLYFIMVLGATILAIKIMPYSNDHQAYLDLYKFTIHDSSYERMEVGFKFFLVFFKSIDFSFEFLWFLIAFISLLLKFHVLKSYYSEISILLWLYFLYCISLLALHEGTQIRAAIAIAIGMVGFRCKNKRLGICLLLFSVIFHYSVILFIVLYILNVVAKPYKFTWLIVVVAISTIMPLLLQQYSNVLESINPLFTLYLQNSDNTEINKFSFTLIFAIIFFIVNFFLGRRLNYYNTNNDFIFKQYNLFSFLYLSSFILLSALSFSPVISIRLYELLSLTPFIIIALLYTKEFQNIFRSDLRLFYFRRTLFSVLWLISVHRFIAYYYINPIINF